MSDPLDREPDPAALDELLRAFGEPPADEDETPDDAAEHGADDAALPDDDAASDENAGGDPPPPIEFDVPDLDPDDRAGEQQDELVIVEQEPPDPDPEPTPPRIIRIDDYSGSTEVLDAPTEADAPVVPAVATGPAPLVDTVAADTSGPIVISAEDELPDAVYVKGSLDEGSGRPIVFIDDDITGDTVTPEADRNARRGIEPRLRARRAAIKRAMGRKRLRWLVFGTLVVLIGVATLALLGSGLFAIKEDQVTVYNAVYTDELALQAVIDDLVGTPALRVDVSAAEEDLEAIPWVEEARVRVDFPHAATIELRERQAMATYQAPDQRYRVLDRDGRVLDVIDGYAIAYVLIMGPDPVDLAPGEFAPQGYAAASELAKNLTSSIRGRVEWIDVTADGSQLSLVLDDGTEVRFGAARDLFNKLLRLETTLANNPDLEAAVIDVSTSEVTF